MHTAANFVMNTLRRNGFDANLVGGCVRDMVLGRDPKDFDVSTNATPEQVRPLFEKSTPVGAKFGVVVVMVDGHQIEVATYRADGAYSDGRRPDEVRYSESAQEDVERRDFTMNGLMSMIPFSTSRWTSPSDFVTDHVGGVADIQAKVVRCIGDANKRFEEDALRMLRAVRFVSQLGFTIEQGTFDAIVANADRITMVSRERVAEELKKLVTGKFAVQGLAALASTGLFSRLFNPSFMEALNLTAMLEKFTKFPTTDPVRGLAMFMTECGSNRAMKDAVDSLKLPTDVRDTVVSAAGRMLDSLVSYSNDASLKRFARMPGMLEHGVDLFEQRGGDPALVARFRALTPETVNPTPLVMGRDLLDMGFKPGPMFTTVLFEVETKQLNGELTTREDALNFARGFAMSELENA
jgi:poly(A) polymerase